MKGNSISAVFTSLWRGLDYDANSADIAVELLSSDQLATMQRARFAPALQALVKARGHAVDAALMKILTVGKTDETTEALEKTSWESDAFFEGLLGGEKQDDQGKWEQSWKYIHSQRQQQKNVESTIKETSFGGYSTHGQNENYGKVDLPIVISLGSGFDVRCQHSFFKDKCNWVKLDRECIQEKCKYYCFQKFKCTCCKYIVGDASGQMTFKNIKAALTEYVTRIVQMDNLCRIKLIWMAEGLFEYLKPKQQRATISHISSVTNALIQHFDRTLSDFSGENKDSQGKISCYLLVPLLSKSIDRPMSQTYGASFGWKFSAVQTLRDRLKFDGWARGCSEDRDTFTWGTLLNYKICN
eukprot:g9406.t1